MTEYIPPPESVIPAWAVLLIRITHPQRAGEGNVRYRLPVKPVARALLCATFGVGSSFLNSA